MADVLHSADISAAEPRRSLSQPRHTTLESPPFVEKQESIDIKENIDLDPTFDSSENNKKHSIIVTSDQEYTSHSIEQVAEAHHKVKEGVELVDNSEAEVHVECSTKCPVEITEVIDDALVVGTALIANGYSNNGGSNGNKNVKKNKRRGGKARRMRDALLNCDYGIGKKREKGLTYSREEMMVLRFVDLEEQDKKWAEVYSGLDALVAKEYDGMVRCYNDNSRSEHVVDFDPRPQFQKAHNLGEDCSQLPENHLDNLNTSAPASCHSTNDEIGSTVVEEEYSEDDDSDEDYSSIQKPAFMVTGEPDFDSGPPQDGLEYLRRVRWEAAKIPKVKVGKVEKIKEQSPYMPQIPDIMECPENLLPHKEWEDSFLADFSELRQGFSQLEPQDSSTKDGNNLQIVRQEDNLHQFLESIVFKNFESTISTENPCELETTNVTTNPHPQEVSGTVVHYPTLSTILKMYPAARNSMLKKRISAAEKMSELSRNDCLWLFALCATVDSPLDADACAALRSLLRKCASLRAEKTTVDDEVVMLNILVTISGKYFGQLEK